MSKSKKKVNDIKQVQEEAAIAQKEPVKFRLADGQSLIFYVPVKYAPMSAVSELEKAKKNPNRKKKVIAQTKNKLHIADRAFSIVVQTIMLCVMFIAFGMIGDRVYSSVSGKEHYNAIRNNFKIEFGNPESTPDKEVPAYPMATPERLSYPEGPTIEYLEALEERNSDFIYWLYIPGTEISYYVMQGPDNNTYLRHDMDKEYVTAGSLFLDFRNNAKTMKGHTIIYGHEMRNLTMFGTLTDYIEQDFFNEHQYFYTYSVDEVTVWKVYSAYPTTIDEYYIETYFSGVDSYYEFIKGFQTKSYIKSDVVLTKDDDVLTLSTCYRAWGSRARFIVNAVKVGTCIIN